MSAYTPPTNILPVFNSSEFQSPNSYVTVANANKNYYSSSGGTLNGTLTTQNASISTANITDIVLADGSQKISNSSTTLDYSNITNGLVAVNTSILMTTICCSADGRYVLGSNAGNYFQSSNYGVTFSTTVLGTTVWNVSMSANGKYRLLTTAVSSTSVYLSTNYGVSYSAIASLGGQYIYSQTMSSSGQCIYLASGSLPFPILVSTNYGVSFTSYSQSAVIRYISCSASGKYVTMSQNTTNLYYSSNYGASFASIYATGNANTLGQATVSADGKVISASLKGASNPCVVVSQDSGATWQNGTGFSNGFLTKMCSTADGKISVALTTTIVAVNFTSNYGVNWQNGFNNITYSNYDQCITPDGLIYYLINSNGLYRSVTPYVQVSSSSPSAIGYTTVPTLLSNQIGYSVTTNTSIGTASLTQANFYLVATITLPSAGVWLIQTNFYITSYSATGGQIHGISPSAGTGASSVTGLPVNQYVHYYGGTTAQTTYYTLATNNIVNTTTWGSLVAYYNVAGTGVSTGFNGYATYTRLA